jgi:predicted DsbA family dithiol-disulfide isomerase
MTAIIEAFADITCPFTHVWLKVVAAEIEHLDTPVDLRVRAWPLEWVNGSPLDADGVDVKVGLLRTQLGVDYFPGFRRDRWPHTTIPALNLADAAYDRDGSTGFEVSLRLRGLLFEDGRNIADQEVLAEVADAFGLPTPGTDATAGVKADYEEGKRRGVRGSPDFWVEGQEFFCPSLEIGHDADGSLTATFDDSGIRRLVRSIETTSSG